MRNDLLHSPSGTENGNDIQIEDNGRFSAAKIDVSQVLSRSQYTVLLSRRTTRFITIHWEKKMLIWKKREGLKNNRNKAGYWLKYVQIILLDNGNTFRCQITANQSIASVLRSVCTPFLK